MDRKETITDINGKEREITIGLLGFQRRNQILKECLTFGAEKGDLDIKEIDYFTLITKVLESTVRGCPIDLLSPEDGDKIFNTYFGELLNGLGGQKNSEKTSE